MLETLPTQPAMLLSAIHTLIRDREFESLADLCAYYERTHIEETHTVAPTETASTVGSGLLPVYATPSVVAQMEHTACSLVAALANGDDGALTEGDTTVGTRMAIDHVRACGVGETVRCTAMLTGINGRQYDFYIEVRDSRGNLLAEAEHTRFRVNAERFMEKYTKQITM